MSLIICKKEICNLYTQYLFCYYIVINFYEGSIHMDNFTFYSPTFFAFGKDTENNAGNLVKRFGGSREAAE